MRLQTSSANQDNFVTIPVNINPSKMPKITMGGWFNSTTTDVNRTVLCHDDGGYDRHLGIDERGGEGFRWSAFTGSGVFAGAPVVARAWTFVALRHDQTTGRLTLDVGAKRFRSEGAVFGDGFDHTTIGRNPSFGGTFDGRIDNVFIYNEMLSDAQVDDIRLHGQIAILPQVAVSRGDVGAAGRRRSPGQAVSEPGERSRLPAWTVDAPLKAVAPVLDGSIGRDDYGPVYNVRFDDAGNPGRLYALTPARSKAPDDYSYRLRAAHTASALYLLFEVRDQDVQVKPEAAETPHVNDCIELFIDADQVSNDFDASTRSGNREGFQIVADADGHQYSVASELTNADWKVATRRVTGGYVVEFEIPLRAVDTSDGPDRIPAKTGAILRFNVGGRDVDAVGGDSSNYAILWTENPALSPFHGGEDAWTVELRLVL